MEMENETILNRKCSNEYEERVVKKPKMNEINIIDVLTTENDTQSEITHILDTNDNTMANHRNVEQQYSQHNNDDDHHQQQQQQQQSEQEKDLSQTLKVDAIADKYAANANNNNIIDNNYESSNYYRHTIQHPVLSLFFFVVFFCCFYANSQLLIFWCVFVVC